MECGRNVLFVTFVVKTVNKLRAVVTRLNDRNMVTTLFEKLAH